MQKLSQDDMNDEGLMEVVRKFSSNIYGMYE